MQVSWVYILVHEINAHTDDNIHKFGTIKESITANFG